MLNPMTTLNNLLEKRLGDPERGNSLVFVVLLMPVFFACFGFAIDIAAATMTTSSLQTNLDSATQSVVSQSRNAYANNRPGLSATEARNNMIAYYDANRLSGYKNVNKTSNNNPFLLCQGVAVAPYNIALPSSCGFKVTSFQYSNTGNLAGGANIRVTVTEKSNTMFLRLIGITELDYSISSDARLGQTFN